MRITREKLVAAGDMSADITSEAQQLEQQFGYSMEAVYTTSGTLAGVLKLQCSLDHSEDGNGNILVAGNWVDIANSSTTIAAAGAYVWNVADCNYPWVRLVYTHHSGDTGSLNVFFFGRGF